MAHPCEPNGLGRGGGGLARGCVRQSSKKCGGPSRRVQAVQKKPVRNKHPFLVTLVTHYKKGFNAEKNDPKKKFDLQSRSDIEGRKQKFWPQDNLVGRATWQWHSSWWMNLGGVLSRRERKSGGKTLKRKNYKINQKGGRGVVP